MSKEKPSSQSPGKPRDDAKNHATLTVAISSSALFDLSQSDAVYREEGLDAYRRYQIEHEDETLNPGEGYYFVQKLLNINDSHPGKVEVILLSRNSADTGLRVFNSIAAHNLDIGRAAFCGGESPYRYAIPFGCHLFLSTNAEDVENALADGIAAATLLGSPIDSERRDSSLLKIAFDGDAVLFADHSERIYAEQGLDAFSQSEAARANEPLEGGPFKPFLERLHQLQSEFPEGDGPIRTALVTARGAPAHERVIKTLRHWDIRLDESLFLSGSNKAMFLKAYGADIFFDDQSHNCQAASEHVPAGHVPHGVKNEKP